MTAKRVVVKQLPERLNPGRIEEFLHEIDPVLREDRPHVVFDFSRVRQMDAAGVEMLLHCMEETTKRDGDLKLAAVPPELLVILELTRVDSLFEIFETSEDATASFQEFSLRGRLVPEAESPRPASSPGATRSKSNGHYRGM